MAATTYNAVMNKIRELSFDRFITPTFFIIHTAKSLSWSVSVSNDSLTIVNANGGAEENTVVEHTFLFTTFPTLDDLLKGILAAALPIEIIYSGSFIPTEPSSSLLLVSNRPLNVYQPIFRQYYFSNEYIEQYFREYAYQRLNATHEEMDTVDWQVELSDVEFTTNEQEHFALWIAYMLVGQRRLYELAGQALQQSTLGGNPLNPIGGNSFHSNSFSLNTPGQELTVQIGDVFTLSEDTGSSGSNASSNGGAIPKDMLAPWMVGSDNVLMDYYSFWYRLQLWLRQRLEFLFGDQSLRLQTVVEGQMHLDQYSSRNWYGWFESYPWAHSSPLRRSDGVRYLG